MLIRSVLVGAVVLSIPAATILAAPMSQASSSDIVVALEAPLTGSQAANGQDMLDGAKLAAAQINAKGGVLGRRIRIVAIDDKADPALSQASVTTAKKAGAIAVVGPYNSSVGVINLPLYLKAGITPVQLTSTNDTDGMGVTVQPKNNQIAPVESTYVKSLGSQKVAMLVDPSTYTQGMADRLKASLTAAGDTVTSVPISEGQADYASQVSQALKGSPDLVYVSTYYPEGSKIAGDLVKSKLSTKCLMGLANVDPAFVQAAGMAASQRCVFSGVPAAAQLPGTSAKAYVAQYAKAFHQQPAVWGTFTYDSANVLFRAISQVKSTVMSAVLKNLDHLTRYAGATGSITITPTTGNRVVVPVFILKVNDQGTFVINN